MVCQVKTVRLRVRDVNTAKLIDLEFHATVIPDLKDGIIIGCDVLKSWTINLKEGYVTGQNHVGVHFRSRCCHGKLSDAQIYHWKSSKQSGVFVTWSMDFLVGLPENDGYTDIWIITDNLSKFSILIPVCPNVIAADLIELFKKTRMVTGENLDEANLFGYDDLNTSFLMKNWLKYVNELQLLLNSSNKYAPAKNIFRRLPVLSPVDDLVAVYNTNVDTIISTYRPIEEFAKSNLLVYISKMENYGNKKRIIHNFQVGDNCHKKYFSKARQIQVRPKIFCHVQDMNYIQFSQQNHDETTDMDDQDNYSVSMSDADDKIENISALKKDNDDGYDMETTAATFQKQVTGTDDVETETIGTDAEEMEEQPLNKSNYGQSNTDPQGSHNNVNGRKIKNYQSNSIADPNNKVDNKNLLDNETTLKEIYSLTLNQGTTGGRIYSRSSNRSKVRQCTHGFGDIRCRNVHWIPYHHLNTGAWIPFSLLTSFTKEVGEITDFPLTFIRIFNVGYATV
ncbi:hypothetical protein ACTA71_000695 [Dictyostelium dimigraforme]